MQLCDEDQEMMDNITIQSSTMYSNRLQEMEYQQGLQLNFDMLTLEDKQRTKSQCIMSRCSQSQTSQEEQHTRNNARVQLFRLSRPRDTLQLYTQQHWKGDSDSATSHLIRIWCKVIKRVLIEAQFKWDSRDTQLINAYCYSVVNSVGSLRQLLGFAKHCVNYEPVFEEVHNSGNIRKYLLESLKNSTFINALEAQRLPACDKMEAVDSLRLLQRTIIDPTTRVTITK